MLPYNATVWIVTEDDRNAILDIIEDERDKYIISQRVTTMVAHPPQSFSKIKEAAAMLNPDWAMTTSGIQYVVEKYLLGNKNWSNPTLEQFREKYGRRHP
jgi:hypothetical protein